ncbi:MAG: alpha/beta fold hydrolase [Saprospiraceae bacterium]|nr:alpha/beta fold hydrolase [Saprospiraceae bacterium]
MKSNHIILLTFLSLFLFVQSVYNQSNSSFLQEEITVYNKAANITLSGTFSRPAAKGKYPTVLLIWGNGPHTRDMVISGSPVFKQLADSLNQAGYAVLRMDKRGFGKSTGPKGDSEGVTTTFDLLDDMQYSYHFLQSRNDVDTSKIGLFGHSEGATIAPMLASREPSVKFVMILCPPAVPGDSIFLAQRIHNMRELGMQETVIPKVYEEWKRLVAFIEADFSDDATYYQIGIDFLVAHGLEKEKATHEFVDQVIDAFRMPWYQQFFRIDPAEYLSQLKMPVLAIFGTNDTEVTTEQNLLPMTHALTGNPDNQITVLNEHDHFFILHKGQMLKKHKFGEMEFSSATWQTMKNWLDRVL